MAKPLEDIALASAIIGINHLTEDVAVIAMPDELRHRDKYPHVFGACDPYWSENSSEALCGELLVYIWHAVTLHGIQPSTLHEALLVIPEYRDMMPTAAVKMKR